MVAIGQGSKQSITSSIQSAGSNLVMVMPGLRRRRRGGSCAALAVRRPRSRWRTPTRSPQLSGRQGRLAGGVIAAAGRRQRVEQHEHADPRRDARVRDGPQRADGRRRTSSPQQDVDSARRASPCSDRPRATTSSARAPSERRRAERSASTASSSGSSASPRARAGAASTTRTTSSTSRSRPSSSSLHRLEEPEHDRRVGEHRRPRSTQ